MMMDVSIIVRFKNEDQYLHHVLNALKKQEFTEGRYEIVAVDNKSTDHSLEVCKKYTKKILSIDDYLPGVALNKAISACEGNNIAILSAHTIPANNQWLGLLFRHHECPKLAGVYGAQLYPINSEFLDKRDLDIFSTTKPRVEKVDSDFWNANSLFPKRIWELQHFDETVFELEDHYWTKQLLPMGYEVHFEPDALVYHYSHIKRLDREHLGTSDLSGAERVEQAIYQLKTSQNSWPLIMQAGLTLSSLTKLQDAQKAIPLLGKTLLHHPDFDVRWRMAQTLGKMPTEQSARYLVDALFDSSFYPRDEATWSLARLGTIATPIIMERLPDFPVDIRPFAALALGKSGVSEAEKTAIEILRAELTSNDTTRQKNAAYFAGELNTIPIAAELIPIINSLVAEESEAVNVYCWALGSLSRINPKLVSWDKLFDISFYHLDVLARFEALVAIGKLAQLNLDEMALKRLEAGLRDSCNRIRYGAIQSIRLLAETGYKLKLSEAFFLQEDDDNGIEYEKCLLQKP